MSFFYMILVGMMISLPISAQDVIVKKNGSTILSKVMEINSSDVKYKKHSNLNGPTYTIAKSELLSINYENGEKDVFDDSNINLATDVSEVTQVLIDKPGDFRNQELLNLYNREYSPTDRVDKKTPSLSIVWLSLE